MCLSSYECGKFCSSAVKGPIPLSSTRKSNAKEERTFQKPQERHHCSVALRNYCLLPFNNFLCARISETPLLKHRTLELYCLITAIKCSIMLASYIVMSDTRVKFFLLIKNNKITKWMSTCSELRHLKTRTLPTVTENLKVFGYSLHSVWPNLLLNHRQWSRYFQTGKNSWLPIGLLLRQTARLHTKFLRLHFPLDCVVVDSIRQLGKFSRALKTFSACRTDINVIC